MQWAHFEIRCILLLGWCISAFIYQNIKLILFLKQFWSKWRQISWVFFLPYILEKLWFYVEYRWRLKNCFASADKYCQTYIVAHITVNALNLKLTFFRAVVVKILIPDLFEIIQALPVIESLEPLPSLTHHHRGDLRT